MKSLHSSATYFMKWILGPALALAGGWAAAQYYLWAQAGGAIAPIFGAVLAMLAGLWLLLRPAFFWFGDREIEFAAFWRRQRQPATRLRRVSSAGIPMRNQPLRLLLDDGAGDFLRLLIIPHSPGPRSGRHPDVESFLQWAEAQGAVVDSDLKRASRPG
ncbi:MAG: hypothetical protein K1X75_16470 [Leptospirales bacterium]|nr:hypothetical protein [Leptospirales bacterium]